MIESAMGNLTPEVETTEVREIEEGEGSSYTVGRDDNEGEDADDGDQVVHSPKVHTVQ